MVVYTYRGKQAYINDRLARELETDIIPDLVEKDSDVVFCIDGGEGTGKSKLSDSICGFVASKMLENYNIDPNYGVDSVHLSPMKFRDAIVNAKKNNIVVYDEAHKGMGSRRSLSEINNILNDLMMEMRQKNLFVILVLPTFFMLDKYPAIFRTRGLFHVYKGVNKRTKKKQRGFWVFFNEKYKLQLYIKGKQYFNYKCIKWPKFKGRFTNQYIMDEKEYRKKKIDSFKQSGKRETKAERFKEQRDKLILGISNEYHLGARLLKQKLTQYGITLSVSAISDLLDANKTNNPQKSSNSQEIIEENEDFDEEMQEKPQKTAVFAKNPVIVTPI